MCVTGEKEEKERRKGEKESERRRARLKDRTKGMGRKTGGTQAVHPMHKNVPLGALHQLGFFLKKILVCTSHSLPKSNSGFKFWFASVVRWHC